MKNIFLVLIFFCLSVGGALGEEKTRDITIVDGLNELKENFPNVDYANKLILIDTRDPNRSDRDKTFDIFSRFGNALSDHGVIFLFKDNDLQESKKLLNILKPNHSYSYNDGPFLVGYMEKGHYPDLFLEFTGMSLECMSSYLQDVEQAIVRKRVQDEAVRNDWEINSILCESSAIEIEGYSFNVEKLWKFVRTLIRN